MGLRRDLRPGSIWASWTGSAILDYATILFAIAAVQLLGAASPGPSFIIVTSYAVAGSRRSGLLVACGILAATMVWAVLAALGLGALVTRFPAIYTGLQLAGAGYLIWLGGKMLVSAIRARATARANLNPTPVSAWQALRAGFLTNMTNPKSIAYYSSVFVVMIPQGAPDWLFVAAVTVAISVSAVWWIALAAVFSVARVQRTYGRAKRAIDAVMGGVLICLGARLVLSR
jgi:threonine efflux protein